MTLAKPDLTALLLCGLFSLCAYVYGDGVFLTPYTLVTVPFVYPSSASKFSSFVRW